MSESHSPEPWEVLASSKPDDFTLNIHDANGRPLISDPYAGMEDEDMNRAVACVNFCRGIPTEELIGEMGNLLHILEASREERN